MNKLKQPSHAIAGVFVFLLLGIFAVFSTVMVLLGAKAYRGTVENTEKQSLSRIAPAYLRSMVRSDDEKDVISVEEISGLNTIKMTNVYDEESYITRIYCFEGQLYEWFSSDEITFEPENGDPVCECESMSAVLKGNLLTVTLTRDGELTRVDIALRGNKEAKK